MSQLYIYSTQHHTQTQTKYTIWNAGRYFVSRAGSCVSSASTVCMCVCFSHKDHRPHTAPRLLWDHLLSPAAEWIPGETENSETLFEKSNLTGLDRYITFIILFLLFTEIELPLVVESNYCAQCKIRHL